MSSGGIRWAVAGAAALVVAVLFVVPLLVAVLVAVIDSSDGGAPGSCRAVSAGSGAGVPEQWADELEDAAGVSGVPVAVHAAMTDKESGFDESAVNTSSGAAGMAQAMPGTWGMYGEGDPMDGADALAFQGRYMKALMDLAGEAGLSGVAQIEGALAAYNWGPGNMAAAGWDWRKGPGETTDYVRDILAAAQVSYAPGCRPVGTPWDGDLGDGEWTPPLPGGTITGAGAYGPRTIPGYPAWANNHAGIDLATPNGDGAVVAPTDMRVTALYAVDGCVLGKATTTPAFGLEFCHLDRVDVQPGDVLARGDVIGEEGGVAGNLGGRTVEHLHFAMYDPSGPDPKYPGHQNPVIDPTPILRAKGAL